MASRRELTPWLLITFGCTITFALGGYQFGQSNHTVYLLDALRRSDPQLLTNDWFTTQTLQYHALFGVVTRMLVRWDIVEPTFLIGYAALGVFLHIAWYRVTRLLGGTSATYVVSVILVHLSANATALGMYQFLQDSAFLPSNISSVALLWGIYGRIADRRWLAALGFAGAGAFHLNYAVVGFGLWIALDVLDLIRPPRPLPSAREGHSESVSASGPGRPVTPLRKLQLVLATTIVALAPSAMAILLALRALSDPRPRMPLDEFVDLYVRLRHPHHYDPSSWPIGLWVAFLWPMPLFVLRHARHRRDREWAIAGRVFSLLSGLTIVSLLGAGVWYVSERLVQMSLMRFTPYLQLLACIAAAITITRHRAWAIPVIPLAAACALGVPIMLPGTERILVGADAAGLVPVRLSALTVAAGLLVTFAAIHVWRPSLVIQLAFAVLIVLGTAIGWRRDALGLTPAPTDDEMRKFAEDLRDDTPVDAIFLVPPDDQSFRLYAQRATIVNFKGVPQLSSELPEWRDRMQNVLAMEDLRKLPRPFVRSLAAIRERYEQLSAGQLIDIAQRYRARYIIATRDLHDSRLILRKKSENARYFLYDLHG